MGERTVRLTPREIAKADLMAERMEKHFVTKINAYKFAITVLIATGIFLARRPIIVELLKGGPKAPPVNTRLKDICENSIMR